MKNPIASRWCYIQAVFLKYAVTFCVPSNYCLLTSITSKQGTIQISICSGLPRNTSYRSLTDCSWSYAPNDANTSFGF